MAFPDPTIITINTVPYSLNKIKEQGLSTTYQSGDQNHLLVLSHQQAKNGRIRTLARYTQRKVVSSPLDSTNDYETATISVQWDRPEYGWTATELNQMVQGLFALLGATNVTKLFELQH